MSEMFGNPANVTPEETPTGTPQEPTVPLNNEEDKPVETVITENPYADLLSDIRGEDGRQKYADVPTALASVSHAQSKISQLSEELKQAQEELTKRKGAEEMLEQLQTAGQEQGTPASSNELAVATVEDTVEAILAAKESQAKRELNRQEVVNTLTEAFGDKAEEVYKQRAAELGMTVEELDSVAFSNPKLILPHFQLKPTKTVVPVTGSVNTASFSGEVPVERKAVMRGSTTKEVLSQYRAHAVN